MSKDGLHAVIGTSCGRPLASDSRLQCKIGPAAGVQQPSAMGMQPDHPSSISRAVSIHSDSSENSSVSKATESVGASSEPAFTYDPQPAIILLELYTLEVIQKFMLKKGQDITAMALNCDNSNLLVSTANRQLLVFTDPSLSVKVAQQRQRFGGSVNAGGSS